MSQMNWIFCNKACIVGYLCVICVVKKHIGFRVDMYYIILLVILCVTFIYNVIYLRIQTGKSVGSE